MRILSLALTLLLIAAVAPAQAGVKPKAKVKTANADSVSEICKYTVMKSVLKYQDFNASKKEIQDQLLQKLAPADGSKPCAMIVKQWKAVQNHYVAMAFFYRYVDANSELTAQIGVFKGDPKTSKIEWVATTEKPYNFLKISDLNMLDFAPYRIQPDRVAFGVRWDQSYPYAGGGGSNGMLVLFANLSGKVQPILETLIYSESVTAGDWNDDGSRDHTENGSDKPAELAIAKEKTGGYFDLIKSLDQTKVTLKWDGTRYTLDENEGDVVEDINNN